MILFALSSPKNVFKAFYIYYRSDDEFEETPSALPATITPLIIEEEEKIITPIKIAPKPSAPSPVSPAPPPTTFPRIQIAQNLLCGPSVSIAPKLSNLQSNQVSQIQTIQASSMSSHVTTTAPKIQATTIAGNSVAKGNGALPFPLLILNGMSNGVQAGQNGATGLMQKTIPIANSNGVGFNAGMFFNFLIYFTNIYLQYEFFKEFG